MCRAIRWGGQRVFQMQILSTELFNHVQVALRNNANNKSETHGSPNLLSGKLFSHNEVRFTNQRTCGKGKTNTHYYATKGFYMPAPQVDEIAIKTITQFLDADLSALPSATVGVLKQINAHNISYAEKNGLIQSLVDKVIYSQEKLICYLTPDIAKLQPFAKDNFISQKSEPMEFTVNDNRIAITVSIVLRKYVNTVFDKSMNGVLTMTENNHLIVKAFTYAFKYRKMYEETGNTDTILESENITWRTLYKYLTLAYLSPRVVNALMSGKLKIPLRDLYDKATKHQEFEDQERLFFNS